MNVPLRVFGRKNFVPKIFLCWSTNPVEEMDACTQWRRWMLVLMGSWYKICFFVVFISSRVSHLCGRTSQGILRDTKLSNSRCLKVFEDSVVAVLPVVFNIRTTTTTVTTAHVTTATTLTTAITRTTTTTGVTRTQEPWRTPGADQ